MTKQNVRVEPTSDSKIHKIKLDTKHKRAKASLRCFEIENKIVFTRLARPSAVLHKTAIIPR